MAQIATAPTKLRPIAPAPAPTNLSPVASTSFPIIRIGSQNKHLLDISTSSKSNPSPGSLRLKAPAQTSSAQSVSPKPTSLQDHVDVFQPSNRNSNSNESTVLISTQLERGSSSTSRSSLHKSSREGSVTPSPSNDENDDKGSSVQPSKEWILPARAKPGRKPSEVEPPTKRKAQNRASQRAFRERKQSYVASLEQKIQEYEKKGSEMSLELQKVAKRLKAENDDLKKENESLKGRLLKLEGTASKSASLPPSLSPTKNEVSVVADALINNQKLHQVDSDEKKMGDRVSPPGNIEMNRDCGFCTEGSYCVCQGETKLDVMKELSPDRFPPAPSLIKNESNLALTLSKRDLPLRSTPKDSINRKLWYTESAPQSKPPVQICPTDIHIPSLRDLRARKQRLWPLYSNSYVPALPLKHQQHTSQQFATSVPIFRLRRSSPLGPNQLPSACTGDPSRCGACSADPALAAFCRAVSSHLSSNSRIVTPAILDAGNALPLRRLKRSHDGISRATPAGNLMTKAQSSHKSLQSIPEAWDRIKKHPSFPRWEGGLDLLADVVSKRAHAETKSEDTVNIQRGSDQTAESLSRSASTHGHQDGEEWDVSSKRRRLYVEKEAVEDALALLDRGSKVTQVDGSCVCPLQRNV